MEEYHELLEALVSNKQINVLFNNLNFHGIQQTDINQLTQNINKCLVSQSN